MPEKAKKQGWDLPKVLLQVVLSFARAVDVMSLRWTSRTLQTQIPSTWVYATGKAHLDHELPDGVSKLLRQRLQKERMVIAGDFMVRTLCGLGDREQPEMRGTELDIFYFGPPCGVLFCGMQLAACMESLVRGDDAITFHAIDKKDWTNGLESMSWTLEEFVEDALPFSFQHVLYDGHGIKVKNWHSLIERQHVEGFHSRRVRLLRNLRGPPNNAQEMQECKHKYIPLGFEFVNTQYEATREAKRQREKAGCRCEDSASGSTLKEESQRQTRG